jgi:hypothetical protein
MTARALAPALCMAVSFLVSACRRAPAPLAPKADANPTGQRGELLERILRLPEVEPCLVEAGPSAVRLVEAELAGEAATATFVCSNGAARGRVTFFRVAGQWTVSTKSIEAP